jgi:hypothetical protein
MVIPTAAYKFPLRAVSGWESIFNPTMNEILPIKYDNNKMKFCIMINSKFLNSKFQRDR